MAGIMVVFDFDKTIIDVDSDNWVLDELGFTDLFNQLLPTMPWNPLMDRMMKEVHNQGKSVEDIKEVLRRIPIHPRIVPTIKAVHSLGCELRIVSDANLFFIETILEHLGIEDCFSEINTNPGHIDEQGRLRISPYVDYQTSPHGCNLGICPPNMCKGLIIERILASMAKEVSKKRMIYLGDGSGDFCPSLKLREGDMLMPRKNFPVWDLLCKNHGLVKAEIHEWKDGADMEEILIQLVEKMNNSNSNTGGVQNQMMSVVDCKLESIPVPKPRHHEALPPPLLKVNQ
ncbi:inorganic pyrophosphatase 1-like [Andrographis paniculata]|uniref:inorganic pyrophosphatase 1-like n=1 Tax=Andrographis paniculata TaxID=175694 RepID=UPI0021E94E4E|nr:inorganic pyrophosphatase 1-like [Andrographis paniculata]